MSLEHVSLELGSYHLSYFFNYQLMVESSSALTCPYKDKIISTIDEMFSVALFSDLYIVAVFVPFAVVLETILLLKYSKIQIHKTQKQKILALKTHINGRKKKIFGVSSTVVS